LKYFLTDSLSLQDEDTDPIVGTITTKILSYCAVLNLILNESNELDVSFTKKQALGLGSRGGLGRGRN